jgi:hypothetical protein
MVYNLDLALWIAVPGLAEAKVDIVASRFDGG